MNIFEKLLAPNRTRSNQTDDSSKRIFQHLSLLIANSSMQLNADNLLYSFIQREKLGSTYIGHGIAIPHLRVSNVEKPFGALIHLKQGISFDHGNSDIADIFFGFVVPFEDNDQHLSILAALAEKFNNPIYRKQLRSTSSSEELFSIAIKE